MHDVQMADIKVSVVVTGIYNYSGTIKGSGYSLTHNWHEVHTCWYTSLVKPGIIRRMIQDSDDVVWCELQRGVSRYDTSCKFRYRFRFQNRDSALLFKLSLNL